MKPQKPDYSAPVRLGKIMEPWSDGCGGTAKSFRRVVLQEAAAQRQHLTFGAIVEEKKKTICETLTEENRGRAGTLRWR